MLKNKATSRCVLKFFVFFVFFSLAGSARHQLLALSVGKVEYRVPQLGFCFLFV